MVSPDRILVYGTLKRGFGANYKLQGEACIGAAHTLEDFFMCGSGFPIIFPATSIEGGYEALAAPVLGELYTLSPSTLAVLDMYEGYPNFYSRKPVKVRVIDFESTGEPLEQFAWVYYIVNERYRPTIEPGNHGFLEWKGHD